VTISVAPKWCATRAIRESAWDPALVEARKNAPRRAAAFSLASAVTVQTRVAVGKVRIRLAEELVRTSEGVHRRPTAALRRQVVPLPQPKAALVAQ
jgi:hypothetical protein